MDAPACYRRQVRVVSKPRPGTALFGKDCLAPVSYTYTKLFSSITESTIWVEPYPTRILWVAMLAMADQHGRVWGSIPGLARRANITLPETEQGLQAFLSPDPYSRTPDHEGRRIECIEGGWKLLNYAKHRAIKDEESQRVRKAKNAKDYRDRRRIASPGSVTGVTDSHRASPQAEAEAEAEVEVLNLNSSDTIHSSPAAPKKARRVRSPTPKKGGPSRHTVFRGMLEAYWDHVNEGAELPWDARDAKQLSSFLAAVPSMAEKEFKRLLWNRARSAVSHGDRVYTWIANVTRYSEPLDEYNKPKGRTNGHNTTAERNAAYTIESNHISSLEPDPAQADFGRLLRIGIVPGDGCEPAAPHTHRQLAVGLAPKNGAKSH